MENDFSEWWAKNSPATGSNSDSQNPPFSPSPTPLSQSPTHPPIRTPTPNRPQGFYPYTPGYFNQFSPGIGYQPAYSPAFSPIPSFSPPPIIPATSLRKGQFKFLNCMASHPDFLPIVQDAWRIEVEGVKMFQVWSKLKPLREKLRQMKKYYAHMNMKLDAARCKLEHAQTALQDDPLNICLFDEEKLALQEYEKWMNIEEMILKQQSKVHWLKCGDGNNKYFHASLVSRRKTSMVVLTSRQGTVLTTDSEIHHEVIDFYKYLLGTAAVVTQDVNLKIVRKGNILNHEQRVKLITTVTAQEVKDALMSIEDDKAPGIDGYSSKFFKSAWGIIGSDVTIAIQDFFRSGRLLKSVNTTLLTLIPKGTNATTIRDFRPIACCMVLY